eukprot:SAG11_NODE_2883_length_2870_cov_2.186214_2_plen_88_part_00
MDKELFQSHALIPGQAVPAVRFPMTRKIISINLTPDVELRAALESHRMKQRFLIDEEDCPIPPGMICAVHAVCAAVPGAPDFNSVRD